MKICQNCRFYRLLPNEVTKPIGKQMGECYVLPPGPAYGRTRINETAEQIPVRPFVFSTDTCKEFDFVKGRKWKIRREKFIKWIRNLLRMKKM